MQILNSALSFLAISQAVEKKEKKGACIFKDFELLSLLGK